MPVCVSRLRWHWGNSAWAGPATALVRLLVDPERTWPPRPPTASLNWKDPDCADAILPLVQHGHAFVRMGALRALKELRRKDTLKPALEALRDADAAVRVQAIGVIGFLKLEESIPALTASTGDSDAHVRRAAVSALAFSQMKPAAESITRALKDDDWMVREMSAETLGLNANGLIAVDQLIEALSDEFWQVRLKAIRSLGKMKVDRAVRPIGGCIVHEQANLRKACWPRALGEIANPEAEPFLALVADDPDPEVRKNSRWALQQIAARKAKA